MEKDIGKINKNEQTDIILRIDDFGGRRGLTIREYVTSERYTGFTKSGVRILAGDFSKFKEMINSVDEAEMAEAPEEAENTEAQKTPEQPADQTTLNESNSEETKTESEPSKSKEELPDY